MRNKVILMTIMGVALMALPAKAQTFETRVEQPNAVFQSTSTMMGSGSQYSANPTLNTDGTATYNGAPVSAPSSRYRAKKGNPNVDENDEGNVPIGDAALPLLLLACAFAFGKWIAKTKPLR